MEALARSSPAHRARGGAGRTCSARLARAAFALLPLVGSTWPATGDAREERLSVVPARQLLQQADEAFEAEDRSRARELYLGVLAVDPDNSRAEYQLGRLALPGSAEAIRRFRRYVQLEPRDPWGRIALGNALARSGAVDEAIDEFRLAQREAPDEPALYTGLGRILVQAGRIEDLVQTYEEWVSRQPDNAAAWFELGQARLRARRPLEAAEAFSRSQRLRPDSGTAELLNDALVGAGPALRPFVGASKDSDDVETTRWGLEGDWQLTPRSRLGLVAARSKATEPIASGTVGEIALVGRWQPRAALSLYGLAGVSQLKSDAPSEAATEHALGRVHLRWRSAWTAPAADVQIARNPLVSTPGLIADPVDLTEVRGALEYPLAASVFALARAQYGTLQESTQDNHRAGYHLGAFYRFRPAADLGVSYSRLSYDEPSVAPYLAPQPVEGVELGAYFESEALWPLTFALDAAAGRQRITRFGEPPRDWTRMVRVWTSLAWTIRTGLRVELEYEYNDSPLGSGGVTPSADWRYHAVLLSVRFGFPARSAQSLASERTRSGAFAHHQ
jgi:tetratricopeptide (TPR) repeat protein